jgi:hypothetical protein
MMVGQLGRLSASLTLFGYETQQLHYRGGVVIAVRSPTAWLS